VGKFGFIYSMANSSTAYYVGNSQAPASKFTAGIGIYYGIGVEKIISKRLTLAPDLLIVNQTFKHEIGSFIDYTKKPNNIDDPTQSAGNISNSLSQTRYNFYPMVQYKIFDPDKRKSQFNPYVAIGPGFSYLSKSTYELKTARVEETGANGNTISGSTITSTSSFNKLTYSAVIMAGLKYRIGTLYVMGDIRFQYGFSNLTNEKRSNEEALFDYGYQINDFKNHNLMGTIGVMYPLYIPKKQIK